MKIEINGFSIELTTDDVNLTLKVSDATGKELSNNTYAQEQSTTATPVEVPSAENTNVTTTDTTTDTTNTADTTNTETSTDNTGEVPAQTEESFVPSFDEFKKLLKEGKIK